MSPASPQDRGGIKERVSTNLHKAEEITDGLRKTNTRLLAAGITASAFSTLVAGFAAAAGPALFAENAGWQTACIVAAFFGFVATVCTGLNQQLQISSRLSTGMQCVGELRSLDVMIATGSRDWDEIVREYEEIVRTYPEFIQSA